MKELVLTKLIDVNVLQKIQNGFSKYTGMAALTTDAKGVPVTQGSGFTDFCMNLTRKSPIGCKRCEECDKKGALMTLENGSAVAYNCHAGLVDFAAPIMVEGNVIGSFIGGQVRTSPMNEEQTRATARELGIDENRYVEAAKRINILEQERVQKAADFLAEIAAVLSEMAYNNYTALHKSRKLERIARSQASFMAEASANMKKNVQEWMEAARKMASDKNDSSTDRNFEELIHKGEQFLSSIEETVEYSRITDGEIELNEDVYSVKELLNKIIEKASQACENKNITFNIGIDDSVPEHLMGDAGRISQMITKLLFDAMCYTENGTIEIHASCTEKSYATMLHLEVIDTGGRMSPEHLKIVKDFLENKIQYFEGNSIGINMIGFLARQMSGTVLVNSTENNGTVFTITLPQLTVSANEF